MTKKYPIQTLTIKGFKSIINLEELQLNQLNILIGANGTGKSNFVAYFEMLTEMLDQRLQVYIRQNGGADRILSYGLKNTLTLFSAISFGQNQYSFGLVSAVDDKLIFDNEAVVDSTFDGMVTYHFGSGDKEARLKAKAYTEHEPFEIRNAAVACYDSISSWRVYHFHDTSSTAGVKRLGSLHDYEYLRADASNLAAFLYRIKLLKIDIYEQIKKVIKLALPYFDDFVLEPQILPSEEEQIRLLWRQKNSDYTLWPSQLSDGSIRFICLVVALLQPDPPSTIIIDEPELGLHPYAITLLAGLLRSASKRIQVIVATQSVTLLNEFSISDLIIVESKDEGSKFKRLNEKDYSDWLEEYSIGDIWNKNILGGRPH